MKTPVWIFSALLLLILAGCGLFVSTAKSFDTATIQQLDQIMAESMAAYQAPGMILWVYDPNKGEYFKAVGTSELSTGKPMNASYLYRIGSLTKTFTGTVWVAVLLHASHNLYIQRFFDPLTRETGPLSKYMIGESGFVLVVVFVILAVIFWSLRHQLPKKLEIEGRVFRHGN